MTAPKLLRYQQWQLTNVRHHIQQRDCSRLQSPRHLVVGNLRQFIPRPSIGVGRVGKPQHLVVSALWSQHDRRFLAKERICR